MSQSKPNPEERSRMVEDALRALRPEVLQPINDTPEARLVERAKRVTQEIRIKYANFVRASGLPVDQISPDEIRSLVARWYSEGFANFTREELTFLVCMLHVEIFLETI